MRCRGAETFWWGEAPDLPCIVRKGTMRLPSVIRSVTKLPSRWSMTGHRYRTFVILRTVSDKNGLAILVTRWARLGDFKAL